MARGARILQWLRGLPWPPWRIWRWSLLLVVPPLAINLGTGFFGNSLVFPLSPFFLREKAAALGLYFLHRPRCLGMGHVDLAPLIARAERQHRLPRGLLAAVVQVESNGRVHRISFAGAMGPGQLTRATARALKVSDPFDPEENIDAAARYLASAWKRFHDVRLVAAAYNAGPGAVVNRQVPHNGETEFYVAKIVRVMGLGPHGGAQENRATQGAERPILARADERRNEGGVTPTVDAPQPSGPRSRAPAQPAPRPRGPAPAKAKAGGPSRGRRTTATAAGPEPAPPQ